ncbi:MAG TPA: type I restriction-modification enzyme R subunit C-terminal domain-containing protein [Candidatus Brocadia sapporoensis]|nr:DEAD/DEAH box helicase family protein [Candidatus Brocadia sp.]HQU30643.1 type I restriction-modification enzyme R subunit C-terminal domain-containing protein [Candidatus Brocadia sapporoensis]
MAMSNQTPEQIARDRIDKQLNVCGWLIQDKNRINLHAGIGVAVREYLTDAGVADYVLFVGGEPVGVIEAKREEEGHRLTVHEAQSEEYASAKLKYLHNETLPFVYESTGEVTRFTDFRDPKPRSRPVFSFHRPETFREWLRRSKSLRGSLLDLPALPVERLRDCQITAINNLETSFKDNRPKALIQMATGSGKTYTAITGIYRLLKYTHARRILFLVDTKNLGEQAEQEFMAYQPNDDNRKFSELYGVHRLKSSNIPSDSQVYISTIQRLYSILKGTELGESAEEENPNERWQPKEVPPVEYNKKLPIEFFDVVVIDECHRSIYNLWKQVLEYFDVFQVGLTATPDQRTVAYFDQNLVSEYSHEIAVADGVNVGYDVFLIDTRITQQGATFWKGVYVEHRERLSRKKRLELQDEDEAYTAQQLDRDVVNPNQIRMIIRTFKEHLPEIFPDRYNGQDEFEAPKTLIFAKTDSHADDIIQIVREEFAEENHFCKKVTYKAIEDPKSVLSQFRNEYHPRIAVTVDMIATGTDVKPLECLLFMRDVKSRNYFEQMKGRGTRTIPFDDLKKVSPSAKYTKDYFVIVDAIGVTKSLKTDSRPLEKKPGVPLKDLLAAIAVGAREEELFTSVANRLTRLEKQITDKEKIQFSAKANGKSVSQVVKDLLNAFNPDTLEDLRAKVEQENSGAAPAEKKAKFNRLKTELQNNAAKVFTGELNEYIENVRKAHEQKIDMQNPDTVINVGWDSDNKTKAETLVRDFKTWIEQHKDEIIALQIFYAQPYRRRELTYAMIKGVLERLKAEKPVLAPIQVWRAYEQLEKANGSPRNELIALVSLIRKVLGVDKTLTAYDKTVDKNFQNWVFKKQAGALKFTEEQMRWLRMIKDHIATSIHLDADDLDYTPFDAAGGKGKMFQLFGDKMDEIINELNEALAA